MMTFLDRSAGNVLGVKASGKLTHADYQQLIPRLEQLIQEHSKVRVLVDLADCLGWQISAVWDDLNFAIRHGGDVERCAVVGAKRWHRVLTKLIRFFFNVRYFDQSRSEEAWQWVLEEMPGGSERSGKMDCKARKQGIFSILSSR